MPVKEKLMKMKKTPKNRKPQNMTLKEWQTALRIEYGEEQNFTVKNLGNHPVFSEFSVYNSKSDKTYRVAIRGEQAGEMYCSCPDFAVNTLGVCKHSAFVKAMLKKNRKTARHFKQKHALAYSEIFVRYGEQRKIMVAVGTDSTVEQTKTLKTYVNSDGTLKLNGIRRFNTFLHKMKAGGHEVRCYDDALELIAQINDEERRHRKAGKIFAQHKTAAIKGIKGTLYPYQYEGVKFAVASGRCIIADEMGLGKTIQAIAASEVFAQHFSTERVLIICPTSVKYQWKSEINKFCNRTVQIIEGLSYKRKIQYGADIFFSIASYEQVYRDIGYINTQEFDVIILDETQRIKNWQTRTAKSIKELKSTYAIALTGTPLENRIEELHSIVEFIDRFRLGPLFQFLDKHEVKDERGKVIGYRHLSQIGQSLKTVLIRRKKKEVQQQLPPRLEKIHFTAMTKLQEQYHDENGEIVKRIAAKWAKYHYLSETDQRRLLTALQRMRMACNDAFLVDKEHKAGHKVAILKDVLQDIVANGEEKVVIFSQWTTMHELVEEMLTDLGVSYVYLHGGVPAKKRKTLMNEFKQNPSVRIFLSTDAGQTGLNLQTASVLINLDLPWNPAKLEQRIGRVHRIGQKKSVQVINFVAQGTIEHGMIKVLKFKKSVFSGVLDGGEDVVLMGETRLSKFMKDVSEVTSAVTPKTMVNEEIKNTQQNEKLPIEEKSNSSDTIEKSIDNDAISVFLQTGLQLITELIGSVDKKSEPHNGSNSKVKSFIETDAKTGIKSLKVPLPKEETIKKIAAIAVPFLSQFLDDKSNSQ